MIEPPVVVVRSVSFGLLACALGALVVPLAACDDGPGGGTTGVGVAQGLAVLSSDYNSTSVALFDPATNTGVDNCLDSAQQGGAVAESLSGDVTLPSQPQSGGELVVIDRGNAALSFVDPAMCAVRTQLSVATAGFKANPHDIVTLAANKAYVTRFDPNLAPTAAADDFDEGDDILIVDPSVPAVVGRIALEGRVATAGGSSPVLPRPDRAVLAEGRVFVTLGMLSTDFIATGTGQVAVIDPATDAVTDVIALSGLMGCSGLTYVAETKTLLVACGGSFGDPAGQAAASGIAEISLAGATPAVVRTFPASTFGTQPLNFSYAQVLDGVMLVGGLGAFPDLTTGIGGAQDALYAMNVAAGSVTTLTEGGAYNLGRVAVDAATKRVFLPDADSATPVVRTFGLGTEPVEPGDLSGQLHGTLPPREVAAY